MQLYICAKCPQFPLQKSYCGTHKLEQIREPPACPIRGELFSNFRARTQANTLCFCPYDQNHWLWGKNATSYIPFHIVEECNSFSQTIVEFGRASNSTECQVKLTNGILNAVVKCYLHYHMTNLCKPNSQSIGTKQVYLTWRWQALLDKQNLLLSNFEIGNEPYAFFQTSKYGIFTTKWVLTKV